MNTKFTIKIASDVDYDNLFAEIYCDDKFIGLVSQEPGLSSFEFETPGLDLNENAISRKCDLEGFLDAVIKARSLLMKRNGD